MDKRVTDVTGDELLARLHSRKDFLRLMGAAGIGAAAGASVLPGAAEGAVRTRLEPTDFEFEIKKQFRPFHLLAPNFVQLDDSFKTNTAASYTPLRPGGPSEDDGGYAVANGRMRFFESTPESNDYYTILRSNTGQEAPFATVIIEVASLPEDGTVYAGLYRDELNYVHAYYDKDTNTVGLEARVNGVLYELGSTQEERRLFETPFRFAFAANENRVVALVGSPSDLGGWRPVIERDLFFETNGLMDLREDQWLEPSPTALQNGFGARSESGSDILIDRVQAGYYGEVGVRDPHCVQYADGTPYIKNNKLYFTLTNAGLGFFEKAHWGVWTMDLSDYTKIEQVGNIFWRNADDPVVPPTKVLGHHAGQIIRDEEGERWIVLASSWGDFGPQGGDQIAGGFGLITYPDEGNYHPPVDIVYDEPDLSVDLLRGVHILLGRRHPVNDVPFPTEGKWDPGLTRIDGTWYLSYVIALDLFSNFQPALAKSVVDHDEALEFVGADWKRRATEGPIIQKLGGEWRLFASTGDDEPAEDRGLYPIYFLRAENPEAPDDLRPRDTNPPRFEPPTEQENQLRRLDDAGYLDAPHPTNIPHPQIVPIPIKRRGRKMTKYIMITFNGDQYYIERLGYGTHGDFYVMQARQRVRGWEFPRR